MDSLSLRIYLDEDVDVLLGRLLVARGFDCVGASELGHLHWSDERQLETATGDNRILVTHNRVHFERLAMAWYQQGKEHSGIVLAFRRANTYDLARRLLPVLGRYDQSGWRNVVMYA